jgi:hypothetical protein
LWLFLKQRKQITLKGSVGKCTDITAECAVMTKMADSKYSVQAQLPAQALALVGPAQATAYPGQALGK